MAKQSRPKPNVCCPTPFPIREIIWGENGGDTPTTFRILTEDGNNLAAEDSNILRKEQNT